MSCSSAAISKDKMEESFLNKRGISKSWFQFSIQEAVKYASQKGISMMPTNLSTPEDLRIHLPFCVLPTEFPKKCFDRVYSLQTHINEILHKIAYDKEIITECFSRIIEADGFTKNLYSIYESVIDDNKQQSLGILRSDYLLNCDGVDDIKQVENNTISVGFCGIGPKLRDLYVKVFKKLGFPDTLVKKLPANESCHGTAKGIVSAWMQYKNARAGIVFIVEEHTFNISDQRTLEEEIHSLFKNVTVLRCTFKELRTSVQVYDKKLFVKDMEVAVVYYRVGYSPNHYEEEDWTTRRRIEKSLAIKCPSIGLHLAGTKRIQLYLTREGVLERYVSADVANKLRSVFTGQYLLDTDEGRRKMLDAMENPNMYVLKPEREGGGNNLYGNDIVNVLRNISSNEMNSYILMDRISPPKALNCILRHNEDPQFCDVTNELGIFGVVLGNRDAIYENYSAGHLLRSKPFNVNEGGVASGNGALDYVYLVDDDFNFSYHDLPF